jgi:DNA-binding Lrp family transcriptional regulator
MPGKPRDLHPPPLDQLDILLIRSLAASTRPGFLELSRLSGTSRATVQARLHRLEALGVITGYGPGIDLVAAGFPVHAFVSLQIAQGRLEEVGGHLAAVPAVLAAHATSGSSDVVCEVRAASHEGLLAALLAIDRIPGVTRSTSEIALSEVVPRRHLALLEALRVPHPRRVPRYQASAPRYGSARPPG